VDAAVLPGGQGADIPMSTVPPAFKPLDIRRAGRHFPWDVQKGGRQLYLEGGVSLGSASEDGSEYHLNVEDGGVQAVVIRYSGGKWGWSCSCKRSYCSHAAAGFEAALDGFTVRPVAPGAAAEPTRLAALYKERLGVEPGPAEARLLNKVEQIWARLVSRAPVYMSELQPFCPGESLPYYEPLRLPRGDLNDASTFITSLVEQLMESRGTLVDWLAEMADWEAVERRQEQKKRKKEISEWNGVLKQAVETEAAHARAAKPIQLRLMLEATKAEVEIWDELAGEFRIPKDREVSKLLDAVEDERAWVDPSQDLIWQLALCNHTPSDYYGDSGMERAALLRRILSSPVTLPFVHDRQSGRPIEAMPGEMRWNLQLLEQPAGYYELSLSYPDGSPARGEFLPIWTPGKWLAVRGHELYQVPPLPMRGFGGGPLRIPRESIETGEGIAFLRAIHLDPPKEVADRLVVVEMRARLTCSVKVPPGQVSEYFMLTADATAADGTRGEVYGVDGWREDGDRKTAKRAPGKLYTYSKPHHDAVASLTRSANLSWDYMASAFRMRVTKNFPAMFMEWHRSIPEGVEVVLDPLLRSIVEEPIKAALSLECEEVSIDWFDLKVSVDVKDYTLSREELRLLLKARGGWVRLEGKGWRRLNFDISPQDDEALARMGLSTDDFSGETQRLHAMQLADKAAARFLPPAQTEQVMRRAGELKTRVTPDLPAGLNATLRPYQLEGFHFLAYLTENRFGGVLADDMGLGKTLQTLAWLGWLKEREGANWTPAIVICPKSVMDNWKSEAEKFLPAFKARIVEGTNPSGSLSVKDGADLLIINYNQLRLMAEGMGRKDWSAVILDEGQHIKNPQSQTAMAARSLKTRHRLVLTGTPIENRLLDLWSLMSFAMPGVLGNKTQFKRSFDQEQDPLARRRLSARVRPFLLRRTKNQVAQDLPDRIEEDLICEMEGVQKKLYDAELKRARQMLLGVKTQKQLNDLRFNFLSSLMRLRQICCHPALVDAEQKKSASAKLESLMELLEPLLDEGHKVLIFSQFVTMLDLIREQTQARKWDDYYLVGETEDRGELVKKFQKHEGGAIFLISLKAGGFGLNLTAASYVVLFDPWWNPAVENQAIDRTHRIGQLNKVIAYRLLIKGSIEDKIRTLQKQKSSLAEDVLGEEKFSQGLTMADFSYLLGHDEPEMPAGTKVVAKQ